MRDMGASLDQKNRHRSCLEKSDHLICQTGQSGFYRENICSNYFPKMILRHFRHDVGNRYKLSILQQ
jgi:hypothetical protein